MYATYFRWLDQQEVASQLLNRYEFIKEGEAIAPLQGMVDYR